jgi:tetratricopeptide (TPR) repeat protein
MAIRTHGFDLVAAKLPARLVIRALTAHVRDIALLLDAIGDAQQRRNLTVTGGESSYLAACCDVDLGNLAGALDLLDTVDAAARNAADPVLAAMASDGQSHYQAFQGHHHRALELIEQARTSCPPGVSPGTIAYLWLRTAEEHATLGHVVKAAKAWQQSEEHYERTDLDADRNWVRMWLSRDCFESVRAVIYSATGRQKKAAESAERVATRLARRNGKTDAIALINAALAQARIGLFNAAAATGLHALHATRASEASGCLPRAQEVAAILADQANPRAQVSAFFRDLDHTKQQLGVPL